ncbi:MAG: tetratricopeptide repeat protein [Bryobacterales bacterium]|nr:tetratricopeptide repeat protein [Bryobacterales bacterium]
MCLRRELGIRAALAVLSPIAMFFLLETSLRVAGAGFPPTYFVPVPGADKLAPNGRFGERFFPKGLVRVPAPHLLANPKTAGVYRIFVFGESAAMGVPEPGLSFGRIMEVLLARRYPGVRFEVVNTAMTAINSHAILPIARECAGYEPNLFMVYMGNNEVVGPYGPGTVFTPAITWLPLIRLNVWQRSTRSGQWVGSLLPARQPRQDWRGMEMFKDHLVPLDDSKLADIYGNFRRNLEDIVAAGRSAGVPVLLSTVAVNLKDSPPFAGSASAERFRAGQQWMAAGDTARAGEAFARARDLDELRFRADSRINNVIREVAARQRAILVDAERVFGPAPGDELFYEHVHLRFAGNYLLARTMAERIEVPGQPAGEWPDAERAAALLPYTPWDGYRMAARMQAMMERPPFTNQPGYEAARRQRLGELATPADPAGALPLYRAAVAVRTKDIQLALRYVDLLRAAGRLDEAVEVWRNLIPRAPIIKEWHAGLAGVLSEEGRQDEAVAEYRRALELDPEYDLAHFGWGLALARKKRAAEAAEQYQEALRINPAYAEARNNLALSFAAQGRLGEAAAEYERALELEPDLPEAWAGLGAVRFQAGDFTRAAEAYARAVRARPRTAQLRYDYGLALSRLDKLDEAIDQYREALRLDARSADIHNNLGSALARQRRYPEAAAHFRRAMELRPGFAAARLNLERVPHASSEGK